VGDEEELPSDILSSTIHESPFSSPEPSESTEDKSIYEDEEENPTLTTPEAEAHSPSPLIPPPPPAATSFQPRHRHRPSLADLRGDSRQSLFLPHPNAPKAPAAFLSAGPMYIQSPQQRQSTALTAMVDIRRDVDTTDRTADPPSQRLNSVAAVRVALSKISQLQSASTGGQVQQQGQVTIYGRTGIDLSASMGPVPITFIMDPPPATAPPPNTVQHRQQTYPPNSTGGAAGAVDGGRGPPMSASLGYRRPPTTPNPVPSGLRPGFAGQETRMPEPPLPRRQVEQGDERAAVMPRVTRAASATAVVMTHARAEVAMREVAMRTRFTETPALSTPPPPPPALAPNAMNTTNTGSTGDTGTTSNANDPIPRLNFFPKLPGARSVSIHKMPVGA
jgi:hypothetical protein